MPELADLNLGKTRLTVEGVAALVELPALTRLNLNGCTGLTDVAAGHLAKMTRLKLLGLGRTEISLTAAAGLEEALPECMIDSVKRPNQGEIGKVFPE